MTTTTNTMKLFHLTPRCLGESVELKPSLSPERGVTEIETARVSASPSVEQCIVALKSCEWFKVKKQDNTLCLFVYEIVDTEKFTVYSDVFDFAQTSEFISLENAAAKLVGIIHVPASNNATYLSERIVVDEAQCVYERISIETYNKYYR